MGPRVALCNTEVCGLQFLLDITLLKDTYRYSLTTTCLVQNGRIGGMERVTAWRIVSIQKIAGLGSQTRCLSVFTSRISVWSSPVMRDTGNTGVEIFQVGRIRVYVATTVKIKGKTFVVAKAIGLAFRDIISSGYICAIVCVSPNGCLKCILRNILKFNKTNSMPMRIRSRAFCEKYIFNCGYILHNDLADLGSLNPFHSDPLH